MREDMLNYLLLTLSPFTPSTASMLLYSHFISIRIIEEGRLLLLDLYFCRKSAGSWTLVTFTSAVGGMHAMPAIGQRLLPRHTLHARWLTVA